MIKKQGVQFICDIDFTTKGIWCNLLLTSFIYDNREVELKIIENVRNTRKINFKINSSLKYFTEMFYGKTTVLISGKFYNYWKGFSCLGNRRMQSWFRGLWNTEMILYNLHLFVSSRCVRFYLFAEISLKSTEGSFQYTKKHNL